MSIGAQQLFQHVTLWSQFPIALTRLDPLIASSLSTTPKATIESLNRFVREMRLQEIGLLKVLSIDPDALKDHLEKKRSFSNYFLKLAPRPEWMKAHPNPVLTIDDLHQLRMAVGGAKSRLNHWAQKPNHPRPAGLAEHLQWLQESAHARAELARLAAQMGEPEAGIERFFNSGLRQRGRVFVMEESLKLYFQVTNVPK